MCKHVHESADAFGGQKMVLSPLELEGFWSPNMGAGN